MGRPSKKFSRLFKTLLLMSLGGPIIGLIGIAGDQALHPYAIGVVGIAYTVLFIPFFLMPLLQIHLILSAARIRSFLAYTLMGAGVAPGLLVLGYGPNSGPDFRLDQMRIAVFVGAIVMLTFRALMHERDSGSDPIGGEYVPPRRAKLLMSSGFTAIIILWPFLFLAEAAWIGVLTFAFFMGLLSVIANQRGWTKIWHYTLAGFIGMSLTAAVFIPYLAQQRIQGGYLDLTACLGIAYILLILSLPAGSILHQLATVRSEKSDEQLVEHHPVTAL